MSSYWLSLCSLFWSGVFCCTFQGPIFLLSFSYNCFYIRIRHSNYKKNVIGKFQSRIWQAEKWRSTLKGHIALQETKGDKETLLILSASVESRKIRDIEKRIFGVFSILYHIMATQGTLLLIFTLPMSLTLSTAIAHHSHRQIINIYWVLKNAGADN